ncbi:mannose-1-phosphate guanylyltransferase [Pontibacter ummariensis]|uniref:mannose-1-phosphate guanylyltransferase n=1 Tax=Pontibacter ummariensis TaxID=1610492 RepID=A0A239L8T7_9BACT|nr:mannose-1-phosphate guanylyltransferase [Pontibacter ummariensis]PRY03978.1 mannose-1-phosphate guanylyltransferase [Pontibacter ummariensis]SNT26318.1 mannose-1-phosphate guanylyltransferase [Pontibacter ummariensis]
MNSNTYVLIMAGGVGSRFWPKSRNSFPKQFIDILGIGKSLLQLTYERFLKLCPAEQIYVVTNSQYKEIIAEQLPELGEGNIICEPSRNNTAPCIAYASFKLAQLDPDANVVVAPSDHFILYEDVFIQKLQEALRFSQTHEALLTLGISPTRPDTGYGYINYSKDGLEGVHKVIRFTEKPDKENALRFLASGDYLWNAGIFIWKASTVLNALQINCPEVYALFEKGVGVYNTPEEEAFIQIFYPQSPNVSIDYAIMEKADNIYTLPAEIGWSDLGTWASLYEVAEKNADNNVLAGKQVNLQETQDCIIHVPENKLAVIRGLQNFIVVDDGSVLLIYPKEKEQEIKKVSQDVNLTFEGRFM